MINAGNTRRENTQAYLIPLLAQAGFNVVPNNGTAEEVFQQRLPSLDYDLAMYISTAPPDPTYLTPSLHLRSDPDGGEQLPGSEPAGLVQRGGLGGPRRGRRRRPTRPPARSSSRRALRGDGRRTTSCCRSSTTRSRASGAPTRSAARSTSDTANYRAFDNFHQWEDVDGDGQIVIGAEQWPGCLNPVTECANSSWYVWTTAFPFLPAIWDTHRTSRPSRSPTW